MDNQIQAYRTRHHDIYKQKKEKVGKIINDVERYVEGTLAIDNVTALSVNINTIKAILETESDITFPSHIGPRLLDLINNNKNIRIDCTSDTETTIAKQIKENVAYVLQRLGLEASDMELQYHMDTSHDEEIAKELARQLNGPAPRPRRGRRRNVPQS